jgi:uncharacterized protein (TIGR00369 family)
VTAHEQLSLDTARQILAAQPFSRLVGAELTRFEPGTAVLEIGIRDDLRQHDGHLHGGVLAYAADAAVTFAAGSTLGPSILTSGLTISYLRPAQGHSLRAEAHVVHTGARQVVARCDLYAVGEDGETTLCAVAQGSAMTTRSR